MTSGKIESIKATIAKLITLATNDGATENEKNVAMERAQMLMAKYQLDEAQILREKIKVGIDVEALKESADCYYTGKLENWEYKLGWAIGPLFECETIRGTKQYSWISDSVMRQMHFIGMPTDLSLVLYFFDYCQNEIARHMEAAYPKSGQKVRNSFALGMVSRIVERLTEFYTRYKEELSNCTDIVIYKKDAVMKKKKEEFPKLVSSYHRERCDSKEYLKGRAAADHVHLSSNLRQVQNGG